MSTNDQSATLLTPNADMLAELEHILANNTDFGIAADQTHVLARLLAPEAGIATRIAVVKMMIDTRGNDLIRVLLNYTNRSFASLVTEALELYRPTVVAAAPIVYDEDLGGYGTRDEILGLREEFGLSSSPENWP